MPSRKLLLLVLLLAILGFADAGFLTIEHFRGAALPCVITTGCDTVTTSAYSNWGPIPVALLGAFFYLALIILTVLALERRKPIFTKLLFWLSVVGLLESAYFVYLQGVVIRAWCFYCLVSATIVTLIFLISWARKF